MTERAEITGAAVPGAEVEAAGTAAVGTGASGTGCAGTAPAAEVGAAGEACGGWAGAGGPAWGACGAGVCPDAGAYCGPGRAAGACWGAFGCAVCAVLWWAPSYAYVSAGAVPRAAGAKGDAVRPLLGVYSLFIVPVFQGAGGVFMPLGDDIFAFCTGVFGGISSLGWRRRGGVLTLRYDVGKY